MSENAPAVAQVTSRRGKKGLQRRAFLDALLAGANLRQAADAAGILEETATRWLADLEFRRSWGDKQRWHLGIGYVSRIIAHAPRAEGVIFQLALEAKDEMVRLRAAQAITDKADRLLAEHPDYMPSPGAAAPMFVLPAGTKVLAMIGPGPALPAAMKSELDAVDAEPVTPEDPGVPEAQPLELPPPAPPAVEPEPEPDLGEPVGELEDYTPTQEELAEAAVASNVLPMFPSDGRKMDKSHRTETA